MRAEKIDYDQKMEKYDEAIATHRAKIEHWKKEMSKIKLHPTDDNTATELILLTEEELADIRVETYQNMITKAEAELGRMTPNLQVRRQRWNLFILAELATRIAFLFHAPRRLLRNTGRRRNCI